MPLDGLTYIQSASGIRPAGKSRAKRLSLDFETFSEVPLTGAKSVGIWNYSSHASTEVLMAAYRLDNGPLIHVDLTQEAISQELYDALCDPTVEKWAFNAAFERLITLNTLGIPTPYEGWRCTMALANMQSFTGDLLQIGTAMGLPAENLKDKEGSRLIRLFCGPQRITKKNPHLRRTRETDPEDWEKFCGYNTQDVPAEEGIRDRLIRYYVPVDEWQLYEIDQRINDTGMPVNRRFVEAANEKSEIRRAELHRRMMRITGLSNPNSGQQFIPWLQERGYGFDDLQKATVAKVLKLDAEWRKTGIKLLEDDARTALRCRRYASQTSVKKYPAILRRLAEDDFLRHCFQFVGAARTLRWAGRGPQPHNLTKTPKVLEWDDDLGWQALENCADVIENGTYSDLCLYVEEPMIALAGSVRSSFQAPEGYELRVCDLSAIESAVLAWLSGCERMLDVFREGRDPYKDFGTELYRKAYDEITKAERTICKPAVLGCGYQLGGGDLKGGKRTGLWGYAENMGVDITRDEAHNHVGLFRDTYEEIPQFWHALEAAAKRALGGTPTTVNKLIRFEYKKPYLTVTLPSGRPMYYFRPRIETREFEGRNGTKFTRRVLSYMGKSQITHQWGRVFTSGGKQTENVVQATARDILKVGIMRAAADGFKIVGHVHDEIITLARKGDNYYTTARLREHMMSAIDWAVGLPLGAAGYSATLYRKD